MIWIDGRWWDTAALAKGVDIAAASEQVQAVLDFSRAWLRGEELFEVHTSGSTGLPKPIWLTRSQMEASALATGAVLGLTAGMTALVCLPVRYIAGRMLLVRGVVWGLKLVVVEPASDPLAELPDDAAVDVASFVPLQLQTLLDRALASDSDVDFPDATVRALRYRRCLDSMHAILVGGGPVSPALATQIRQIKAPVYHTYGMTETATHVALRRLNGVEAGPAFVPLPGVDIGVDGRSCLHLRGPMTAGATIQTNDRVELQPNGSFVWIGRWDNVLNSGGVKVHVESVEATIEALAADQPELGLARRRFFVAGQPDERLGQEIVLVVEGAALDDEGQMQLRRALNQALPRHHAPRRFIFTPCFAVTPTGKIDRKATLAAAGMPLL